MLSTLRGFGLTVNTGYHLGLYTTSCGSRWIVRSIDISIVECQNSSWVSGDVFPWIRVTNAQLGLIQNGNDPSSGIEDFPIGVTPR